MAILAYLNVEVELATPERERWIVQTESFYDARARVYLELADATPAEAERGMAMLEKLVGRDRGSGLCRNNDTEQFRNLTVPELASINITARMTA